LPYTQTEVINLIMSNWRPDFAEAIPISRAQIAEILGVSTKTLSNWLDRNELWPDGRQSVRRGYYRLADVFDIAGFSALRIARIPEQQAAMYTRNYGFYGSFLHNNNQMTDFSHRNGIWDIGIYDPSAIVSLRINMRTMGELIFRKISESTAAQPNSWPIDSFERFRNLYREAIRVDLISQGTSPLFEADSP
jgi:hypothetical protein